MKHPFIIALIGLVGCGKTTVAKELARLTKATVIQGDAIRIQLRKQGKPYSLTGRLIFKETKNALRHGRSIILDGDWHEPSKRKKLFALAQSAARVFFVQVYTDPDIIMGRIIHADYTGNDLYGGAATTWKGSANARGKVVKVREMWRRTPHHFTWSSKNGGQWTRKKLSFPVAAAIDTTDEKNWTRAVKALAKKLG